MDLVRQRGENKVPDPLGGAQCLSELLLGRCFQVSGITKCSGVRRQKPSSLQPCHESRLVARGLSDKRLHVVYPFHLLITKGEESLDSFFRRLLAVIDAVSSRAGPVIERTWAEAKSC
jgi:hypothetical protein